jgi:flagellar motor switch protein FliN/FliY
MRSKKMQASEMTETTKRITEAFRAAVNAALSEISTSEWEAKVSDQPSSEKPDLSTAAGFRFVFDGVSAGDVIVGVYYDLIPRFAFRDLSDDTPDLGNVQKAKFLSALQGRASQLEEALPKAGSIKVELVDNPVLTDQQVFAMACKPQSHGDDALLTFHLCISPKVISDLHVPSATPFVFSQAAESTGANLDLVMEVELNVTLRFGQRQLALREVLELASGSVVELDRQVDEPIELILDGKVVARGEAVIIDGNYGMRVTQVLQPFVA